VAQTASVIGRSFDHSTILALAGLPEAKIAEAMQKLVEAELVFRRGTPPDANYLFKHALVRDAAYESLLKTKRVALHARLLDVLEDRGDTASEIRAQHAEAAGLTGRAIDLWEAASKAAIARPAYDEGVAHLEHAIALIPSPTEKSARAVIERALSLQVQLGVALILRQGYGADQTKAAFEHALVLADMIGETPFRFTVLYGLWAGKYLRSDHAGLVDQAETLVALAESSAETTHANRTVGTTLCMQGRLIEAQARLDSARASFDPVAHKGFEVRFGQDLGVPINCYAAINLSLLGQTRRAANLAEEAERAALVTGHANTICYMHDHLGVYALISRDESALERHAAAAAHIATEHQLVVWRDVAELFEALLVASKGDPAGIELYLSADTAFIATKSRLWIHYLRIEAGWRALSLGLPEKAAELAAMASAIFEPTGEAFALSDFHRLEGALAREKGDQESAEGSLKKAIAVARKQASKTWELRAAVDLARLWLSSNRFDDARALLQPIHDTVDEGDLVKDRATAHAILADIAA
jgi:tetratricopeptide (TPR) repeat protein